MNFDYCPHCGAELPAGARACPECGSDEKTGWSDQAHSERLGIPDEDFDYEQYVREEFGPATRGKQRRWWLWWAVAALLLALFLGGWVLGVF